MSVQRGASSILVLVLIAAALFVIRESRKPEPVPNYKVSEKVGEVNVVIPSGASGDEIAEILFVADIVKSPRAFFAAATIDQRSKGIQAGTYKLNRKLSGKEALNQLLDRKRLLLVLLIREGARNYELVKDLKKLKFADQEIQKFIDGPLQLQGFGSRTPEGFYFPATYNLTPSESLENLRNRLLGKFSSIMEDLQFETGAKKLDLSPYQALIIASIVEAEGFDEDQFRKVARVIYNRLKINMPLQMDSTLLYALKERRIEVTKKDLKVASLYNTYTLNGLPPTPICNPGEAALFATLNPVDGNWLYFVTTTPGVTKFTADYGEFLSFKREFQVNLKEGKFGDLH